MSDNDSNESRLEIAATATAVVKEGSDGRTASRRHGIRYQVGARLDAFVERQLR
jgi:hypothetical protein